MACPDSLEKIFQQVEEATERRVYDETFRIKNAEEADDKSEPDSAETSLRIKSRRRGSVSISRFGQLSDHLTQMIDTSARPATGFPRRLSTLAPPYSTIFQNHTADSLASDNLSDEDAHTEDAHHVTQMHQIVGRRNTISRAVGGLLPGMLGRARSASVVAPQDNSNINIGVSVEEATTEHPEGDDTISSGPTTVVHSVRSQRSMGSLRRKESLMDRAREMTKKLRRRSKTALSVAS